MKILARGEKIKTDELKLKLTSSDIQIDLLDDTDLTAHNLHDYQLIFDLDFDAHPHQLKYFAGLKDIPVVVNAVNVQLSAAVKDFGRKPECKLIGMNAIPTFINRSLAELSAYHDDHKSNVEKLFNKLAWDVRWVEDRVGMVTPRIVMMIMNEACYTVQEGTASMQDIDTSMKLGTNYPFGPFEWANKIGVKHVYETLEAIYQDTHDERYKICPLLKTHYIKNEPFSVGK
jgi:3-hydroxybutyryl-CoA dehydrogenase